MVHGLEAEYWRRVDFVYLDVDNRNNWSVIRERFGDSNTIPRFYIIGPDGNLLYQWIGVKDLNEMRYMLDWTASTYPARDSLAGFNNRLETPVALLNRFLHILQLMLR